MANSVLPREKRWLNNDSVVKNCIRNNIKNIGNNDENNRVEYNSVLPQGRK